MLYCYKVQQYSKKEGDNMKFQIRKARVEDALPITIVSAYTWKTTYSGLMPETMLDQRIADIPKNVEHIRKSIQENENYLVAVVDHTVVAFCAYCSPCRNPDYADSGEIGALYCLKGYQGYGIGKALFLAAAKELHKKGHKTMLIDCLKGNSTLAFYEHMGGRVVGERAVERSDHSRVECLVFYEDLESFI